MQEEVENRAVTLVISATKLTGRLLKAAILKYLASRKEKRLQKARAAPEKPTGKQTVKQLIGQNQGVSNIEITDSNIKSFEPQPPAKAMRHLTLHPVFLCFPIEHVIPSLIWQFRFNDSCFFASIAPTLAVKKLN